MLRRGFLGALAGGLASLCSRRGPAVAPVPPSSPVPPPPLGSVRTISVISPGAGYTSGPMLVTICNDGEILGTFPAIVHHTPSAKDSADAQGADR